MLFRSANELGRYILGKLKELEAHPLVGNVRGKGLIFGIEIVADKVTKEPALDDQVDKIIRICRKKGLIIGKNGNTVDGSNNIITIGPPLSSTYDDAQFIIETMKSAFEQVKQSHFKADYTNE